MIDEQNGLYKFIEQPNRTIVYDDETPSIVYSSLNNFFERRDFEIQQIGSLDEIILYYPNCTSITK